MVGSFGSPCRYERFFILPSLLWSDQYKRFFSSPYTISLHVSPSPSNLGRQSCIAACLLKRVSGRDEDCKFIIISYVVRTLFITRVLGPPPVPARIIREDPPKYKSSQPLQVLTSEWTESILVLQRYRSQLDGYIIIGYHLSLIVIGRVHITKLCAKL